MAYHRSHDIESVPNRSSPPAILLREGWREGGKVRKTLANLSKWPPTLVEGLRVLLAVSRLDDAFDIVRSRPHAMSPPRSGRCASCAWSGRSPARSSAMLNASRTRASSNGGAATLNTRYVMDSSGDSRRWSGRCSRTQEISLAGKSPMASSSPARYW